MFENISVVALGDRELIALIKDRNESAFSEIYDACAASLYGIILRVVCDEMNAGIVFQKTFVCIWNNINVYDATKEKLFTWMIRIAIRESLEMKTTTIKKCDAENILWLRGRL